MADERRLLVVSESLGIGGTETHLIRLLVPLAARGWNITVYCLTERGCRADQVEQSGIRVLSPPRLTGRRSKGIRHPANVVLGANHLFWLMRKWRPHIAHFYLPGPYIVGAPVAIATGTPIKIMSRRSLSHYQQHWPMVARLERLLHRRMDTVIGNSRAVVDDLETEGIPGRKIQLIYNGIDTSTAFPESTEARRALGVAQEAFVGVVIANLIPYKGHKDLIEGLACVAQRLPTGWRVLCAGRDEGQRVKLEKLAEARGIDANIQFLGECAEVSTLLAAADCCVLSSLEEGFSNVILEAMSAGLPMIVTAVGGNPEAVLHEETGIVVPARDPLALGEAVLTLAQDPDLRRRLGAAAQLRAQHEFSIQRCVEAHERLYERLLSECLSSESITNQRATLTLRWPEEGQSAADERKVMQLDCIDHIPKDHIPKVTVVIPTHNRGRTLRAAAASVLTQSFDNLELLVIDDGSSEDLGAALAAILEDPRVRIVRHAENRGAAAARNTGTSLAKGAYIAFLDSDDIWHREKLDRQLAWMESKERVVSCTGYRVTNGFHTEDELRLSRQVGFQDLLWGCVISPGSTMVAKRDFLEEVGPFDESLRRLEDWEWLLRCAQITPIGVVPEILALIHVSTREAYPWEDVANSASIIESYALTGRYPLGKSDRRVLRSTLHSEVAAAGFRRRQYGSAMISFLKAAYYQPLKRAGYYRRIARAVRGDVRRFVSRSRLTPKSNSDIRSQKEP
jgi:glycosyltransferase involved in cell wall biosynthesis